jgi:hypothetical protein
MGFFWSEIDIWLLVGILVTGELMALAFLFYFKPSRVKGKKSRLIYGSAAMISPAAKKSILEEVERLRAGGQLDESLIRRFTSEERALFEIALIDALTESSRKDQNHLRMALIKNGYDELCARRSMSEPVSDRVRASTLLRLLRPLSQGNTGALDSYALTRSQAGEKLEGEARKEKTKAQGE